jgi:hypothetical protein
MKIENKKYLVYGGFAVIVGALGYIAYASIFNKNSNVEETETVTPERETTSENNPFRDMLDNPIIPPKIDYKFNFGDFGYNPNRDYNFTKKSILL